MPENKAVGIASTLVNGYRAIAGWVGPVGQYRLCINIGGWQAGLLIHCCPAVSTNRMAKQLFAKTKASCAGTPISTAWHGCCLL